MRRLTICFALAFAVGFNLVPRQNIQAKQNASPAMQGSPGDLISEVNALRAAQGLAPYTVNPILMRIAQDQANYMAATGQVAHRPGLTERILNAGYPLAGDLTQGGFRAENITGGSKSAVQAVQGWTGDAPHLNTMLSPVLTEIGAGVAQVGDKYYMVIDCARPTTGGIPQAYTPNPEVASTESFSPGDFIVPITVSTPDQNGMIYHEVQYGQTLWAIAIEYGVKIDEIRALNGLGNTIEIYQGQKLLVRKDLPLSTVAATDAVDLTPTEFVPTATATMLSSPTVLPIVTSKSEIGNPQDPSGAGISVGILLAALLFAGFLTWISSRRLG